MSHRARSPRHKKKNTRPRRLLRLDTQPARTADFTVLTGVKSVAFDGDGRAVGGGIPREHLAVAVCDLQPRLDIDVAIP